MNKEHPRLIETRTATVERVSESLVELRFKPDVKLDVEGLNEIVVAKRSLMTDGDIDVLAIMPSDMDFELNVLNVDHSAMNGGCGLAKRLAFAAQSTFNEKLVGIYFRYNPRPYPTEVFLNEADARKWLTLGLPAPSAS